MPTEWNCSTCTFLNASTTTICDICFNQRRSQQPIRSCRDVADAATVSALSIGQYADGLHIVPDSPPTTPTQQQDDNEIARREQRSNAFVSSLSRNDTIVLLSDSDQSKHEVEARSSDPIVVVELSDTEEENDDDDDDDELLPPLGKRKSSSSSRIQSRGRCGSGSSMPSRRRCPTANAEQRSLSQLEKALEKERLKAAKDTERREAKERRLRERAEQQANRKREGEMNQLNRQRLMGKYKFDEIVVGLDISSMEAVNSERLCEKLKERGIASRTLATGVRNCIVFKRLIVQEALERDCFQQNRMIPQRSSSFKEVQLETLIVRYLPDEFQNLIRSGSLLSTIDEILSKKGNERLILIVEGLERHIAAEQSKRLRNRVRGNNANVGPAEAADNAEAGHDRALQNRPDIDELVADIIFRFTGRCCIQLTKDAEESSEYIARLAEVTAKSWYKRDSSVLLFAKQKKTTQKARSYPGSKEWFNYLLSIDQMSENRAEQMVKKYPNFASLMEAYRCCGSDDARRDMLQDLQRAERRFGPRFSREVFNRIYSM